MTEATVLSWPATEDAPRLLEAWRDGDHHAVLCLAVGEESPWLQGHFPGQPVLPGVVQLRWAIQAASLLWPGLGTVVGITNLKFSHPVLPPAELRLELEWTGPRRRLVFRYRRDERLCASGQVSFE